MSGRLDGSGGGVRRAGRGIAGLVARGLRSLADAVLPPVCLVCHEPLHAHHALCPTCWSGIDFIRPPLCDRLGIPMPFDTGGTMISAAAAARPPSYARARAVARYDGLMRDLVHDLKFRDDLNARGLMGRWLTEAGRELLSGADLIVPVPLSRARLLSRRYNQAALLSGEVARLTGIEHAPLALERTRKTAPQVGLSRSERRENVKGAFAVPVRWRGRVTGRSVVVVDDVITTGATVDAAARALLKAGAARVDVLALALVADAALVPE